MPTTGLADNEINFNMEFDVSWSNYQKLTEFDSALVKATVIKQYTKTKNSRTYQVLKLKCEDGFTFYTTAKKSFPIAKGKRVELEIWAGDKSFYEYLTTFYAYSKILHVDKGKSTKQELNFFVASQHKNNDISNIYQALYTATPLEKHLQSAFSALGVSHLLAISGFHLGVLGALLFFLLKPVYSFFQDKYFPYRNSKSDLFIVVSFVLLVYLLFLDSPASLLRAFAMLVIGFTLYDRGIKIISMQTLLLSVILLLSFFPRLAFSLGFWLSVSGVFYIFLFLVYFKHLSKIKQFIIIPFWVYFLMLPFSLSIFGSFSVYHPLSILWTSAFTIFYPLSIFLHVMGFGYLLDGLLESFVEFGINQLKQPLEYKFLMVHVALSFLSLLKKSFVFVLIFYALFIFCFYFFKYS